MATIRDTAISYVKARLADITIANGYALDIGVKRVHGIRATPSEVIPPAVILMQGEEQVENNIGERFSCELEVAVGFVDRQRTQDPDADATAFMAMIQKAVPIEFEIIAKVYPSGSDVPGKIVMMEVGNTINITSAGSGIVMGQVTYIMSYRRNIYDPSRF